MLRTLTKFEGVNSTLLAQVAYILNNARIIHVQKPNNVRYTRLLIPLLNNFFRVFTCKFFQYI